MEKYKIDEMIQRLEDIDLSDTYSYADYLKWDMEERIELIKGKIFSMTPWVRLGKSLTILKSNAFDLRITEHDHSHAFPKTINFQRKIPVCLQMMLK